MKPGNCELHRIELGGKERELLESALIVNGASSVLRSAGVLIGGAGLLMVPVVALLGSAWFVNRQLDNPLSPNNAGGEAAAAEIQTDITTIPTAGTRSAFTFERLIDEGLTIYGAYLSTALWRQDLRDAAFAEADLPESDRDDFNRENFAPDALTMELATYQIQVRITSARRSVAGYATLGIVSGIGLILEGSDYYVSPEKAPGYEYDPLLDLAAWRTTRIRGDVGAQVIQLLESPVNPGEELEARQKENPTPLEGIEYYSRSGGVWSGY